MWLKRKQHDFNAEIEAHLQLEADQLSAEGLAPAEARAAARRTFGNRMAAEERFYESARWMFWDHLVRDVRFAVRTLARNRGFAAIAIVVLALGIGVNATVFSLVNAVMFKNLPFADSQRILYLFSLNSRAGAFGAEISYPDYLDFRAQVKAFAGLGASADCTGNVSEGSALPENFRCSQVTANTFELIGQRPVLGRGFLPEDERPGTPSVAILGYALWEKRYGKDPSVIGRKIRIDSVPATVVGVMPPGLLFPQETEVWQPLIPDATMQRRQERRVRVFGRLADGMTTASARAEIAGLAHNLSVQYPEADQDTTVLVRGFNEAGPKKKFRPVFLMLLGAVGFVLLIACANVANLLLGRAMGRSREISIRAALGAGRWRVIRQLLVESMLLSIAGGFFGLLIAEWGTRAFDAAVIPTGKPAYIDFSLDYRAFAYLAAISVGSGILFGLAPALRLSRADVNSGLKDRGLTLGIGIRGRSLSGMLVAAEMALAVILLAAAGLMIRSFLNAYQMPTGFNESQILTLRLDPPRAKYSQGADQIAFYQRVTDRLGALPGVEAVSVTTRTLPENGFSNRIEVEGGSQAHAAQLSGTGLMTVGAEYFPALRVRPEQGRLFAETDRTGAPLVAVVNRSFAHLYFRAENPAGKRVRVVRDNAQLAWLTVIGVVPDLMQSDTGNAYADPILYLPFRQQPQGPMYVLVRTAVPPASLGEACRRTIQTIDPDLPVLDIVTLNAQLALSRWPLRVFSGILGIFGAIALLLASVGLYAVMAHVVSRRTHEIGVRIALGASHGSIRRMVLSAGMRPTAIGLAIGLPAALGVARVMSSLFVGVSPFDPVSLTGAALVLAASAVAGCIVPVQRAIRVDPATALRDE